VNVCFAIDLISQQKNKKNELMELHGRKIAKSEFSLLVLTFAFPWQKGIILPGRSDEKKEKEKSWA
jgi:hypothetical protein